MEIPTFQQSVPSGTRQGSIPIEPITLGLGFPYPLSNSMINSISVLYCIVLCIVLFSIVLNCVSYRSILNCVLYRIYIVLNCVIYNIYQVFNGIQMCIISYLYCNE
jgi:hypothetical protein